MARNNDTVVVRQDNNAGLMKMPEPVVRLIPLADIYETADAYVVMLDMPGVTKESISITMDSSSLGIRSAVETIYRQNAKPLYNECVAVAYQRSFNLTDGINRDNVDARYENGVLTLKLLKKEDVKPREITIR